MEVWHRFLLELAPVLRSKNGLPWITLMLDTEPEETIPAEWLAEFDAAARRPLEVRMRYAFIHTYKPVLDDAAYRAFDTMADYRKWCNENCPDWLGFGTM